MRVAVPRPAEENGTNKRCRFFPERINMNWIIINLALAVFWLFLGVGILVVERIRGQSLFGGVIISPGWLALLLAGYNVIRVVTMWKLVKEQRQAREEEEKEREQFLQRPVEVVNPELRFTEDKKTEDRG